jgi:hypothetical protein
MCDVIDSGAEGYMLDWVRNYFKGLGCSLHAVGSGPSTKCGPDVFVRWGELDRGWPT